MTEYENEFENASPEEATRAANAAVQNGVLWFARALHQHATGYPGFLQPGVLVSCTRLVPSEIAEAVAVAFLTIAHAHQKHPEYPKGIEWAAKVQPEYATEGGWVPVTIRVSYEPDDVMLGNMDAAVYLKHIAEGRTPDEVVRDAEERVERSLREDFKDNESA